MTATSPDGATSPGNQINDADPLGSAGVPAPEQLPARMGVEITEWDPDRVVGTMPVAGNRQPYGLLHGGANAVLAESIGSVAAALHAAPDRVALGLELSCTHHRAARDGIVTGVATPVHLGRATATYEIVITDDRGKRTCTARLTCILREAPPSHPAKQAGHS